MPQPTWSIPPELNRNTMLAEAIRDFNQASRGFYNSLDLPETSRIRKAAQRKMDAAAQLVNDLKAMADA